MRTGWFFSATRWDRELSALGFVPTGQDSIYCRQDSVFSIEQGWGVLRREWQPKPESQWPGRLGHKGLWKLNLDHNRDQVQPRFELPPALLKAVDPKCDREEGAQLFRSAIGWALATASSSPDGPDPAQGEGAPADPENGVPVGSWEPPPRDRLDACLPAGGLTVQVGPVLRQGTLICEPQHLALRFPLVAPVSEAFPPGRVAWLEALMVQGNNRWRMVRVGRDSASAFAAEVDLTGVPHALLEPFLRTGLVALRYAVEALVRQADFLADGDAVCRALEVHTPRAMPAKQGGAS